MVPLLQSKIVIDGAISVVIQSRAVDKSDWDQVARAIPQLSGAPVYEVDVRIKAQDEDSIGTQFVWWRMLRALSEKLSMFIYEPTFDSRQDFDDWDFGWIWEHVVSWPNGNGPLSAVRVGPPFLEQFDAITSSEQRSVLCYFVHLWNSVVLLHSPGCCLGKLEGLKFVVSTEHEWNGGRFYFLNDGIVSPFEYVVDLFEEASVRHH